MLISDLIDPASLLARLNNAVNLWSNGIPYEVYKRSTVAILCRLVQSGMRSMTQYSGHNAHVSALRYEHDHLVACVARAS